MLSNRPGGTSPTTGHLQTNKSLGLMQLTVLTGPGQAQVWTFNVIKAD